MELELLDFTHRNPVWNVALDEAIVNIRNHTGGQPLLRLWQPQTPLVVIGRSSRIEHEVNLDACKTDSIAVIRRCSGGASIVTAAGCLMYAVLLPYKQFPELRMLDQAHQFVMTKIQNAIRRLGVTTEFQGTCDLTLGDKKFSGNAVRVTRDWLLYHGTIICSMDTGLIAKYLGQPDRQPEYRNNRSHSEFVTQLPVSVEPLKQELIQEWNASRNTEEWPQELTRDLVAEKYSTANWNHKR